MLPAMDAVETTMAGPVGHRHRRPAATRRSTCASRLRAGGVKSVVDTATAEAESGRVRVAGVVTHRQRPGTAGGVTFLNLEDETGMLNVICTVGVWRRYR